MGRWVRVGEIIGVYELHTVKKMLYRLKTFNTIKVAKISLWKHTLIFVRILKTARCHLLLLKIYVKLSQKYSFTSKVIFQEKSVSSTSWNLSPLASRYFWQIIILEKFDIFLNLLICCGHFPSAFLNWFLSQSNRHRDHIYVPFPHCDSFCGSSRNFSKLLHIHICHTEMVSHQCAFFYVSSN